MRSLLTFMVLTLEASSEAATARPARMWHDIYARAPASSFVTARDWAESRVPLGRHYDVPSYDDPSKFGGGTALPVDN